MIQQAELSQNTAEKATTKRPISARSAAAPAVISTKSAKYVAISAPTPPKPTKALETGASALLEAAPRRWFTTQRRTSTPATKPSDSANTIKPMMSDSQSSLRP